MRAEVTRDRNPAMSEPAKPKLTQQMMMHLNGGHDYSRMSYRIYADGKETKIIRNTTTDGSPKYIVTDDVLICGDDMFDIEATKGMGMTDWVYAHLETGASI